MLSRRLIVNLVVFFLVSAALIAYGFVNLLGDPLEASTDVSAVFPDASGLYPNFSVELNGVDVGSVGSVQLTPAGARVTMVLNHGVRVPDDVVASIDVANDLGEQVVELTPSRGGRGPALRNGAVVPVAPDEIPTNVGQVVASATRLLRAIPAGDLNQLLGDLATALQGQAGNLRTIISASTTFSQEFLAYQRQFTALLANAPPVLDAVTAVGPQLRQDLVNTESLVEVLADQRTTLDTLFRQGAGATGDLNQLLTTKEPDFACLVHDVSDLSANLAEPKNLANLSEGLADNEYFFGAVNAISVQGTAVPLTSGQKANPNQAFLRTRLLLPPQSPPAESYSTPTSLAPIQPGAGCSTEFGNGVGPASQPGFTPAAGGHVIEPTAAEAVVRGGGDPTATPATTDSSYVSGGSAFNPLLPLGLVLPALVLAWGVRPSRRRTRRRA